MKTNSTNKNIIGNIPTVSSSSNTFSISNTIASNQNLSIRGIMPDNVKFGKIDFVQDQFKFINKEYYLNFYKKYIENLPELNIENIQSFCFPLYENTPDTIICLFLLAGITYGTANNKKVFEQYIQKLFSNSSINQGALEYLDATSILSFINIIGLDTAYKNTPEIITTELLYILIKLEPYSSEIESFLLSHIDEHIYDVDAYERSVLDYLKNNKKYFKETKKYDAILLYLDIK